VRPDGSQVARSIGENKMAIRIVRLGTDRAKDEGPRIGTVRRPPRGVPKAEFSRQNWYDVWYPNLAPSVETMKFGQQAGDAKGWSQFAKRYRAEMAQPDAARSIALLATLSRDANFSVGCYCKDESHCHRSLLRALLEEQGASIIS
jgi:uncharacterized protein YeaO (DUF488 family)